MHRLKCTLAFAILAATLSGCGQAAFTEFASPEHKFKALFPGAPKTKTQNVGGMNQTIYYVESRGGGYFVFHQEQPAVDKSMERFVLNQAKEGLNAMGKIKNSNDIVLEGNYPGVE